MSESRPDRPPLVPPAGMDLHTRDMSATFAADVPLRLAQWRLQEHNQWLPIDGDPDTPVGTLVERNSTGPLRLGFGAWRDLLLGVQFTNGRGELITAGGRTVKNVAGYDLTKFMVGQHGVFGKVVTITTRTYLRPAGALLAKFPPDVTLVNQLIPTAERPQWALLTAEALFCGYLGDARTVEYYRATVPRWEPIEIAERSLADDMAHRADLWRVRGDADGAYRAAIPPARIADFVRAASLRDWVADAAFGVVLFPRQSPGDSPADEAMRVGDAAASVGGSAYLASATGVIFARPPDESGATILRRLKQAFDPDGSLASLPGR